MAKSGKLSRNKGKCFEQLIARLFRPIFPNARRQLEYHINDAQGIDLQHTGIYKIQCKRYKKGVNVSKITEVLLQDEFDVPVLVSQADRGCIYATIPLNEFIRLVQIAESID